MDKCNSDAEFDSYWDNEAKNQNRNRIRVGRQYQATIPPLLKPGQKDGRKLEELETLKWKPDQLADQAIEEYLSMAKGIGLFSKSLGSSKTNERSENTLQSALKGLSEFVTSHHPCHHDDGCKVSIPSSSGEPSSSSKLPESKDWSSSEAQLFAQALDSCGKNFSIKKENIKEEAPDCTSEEDSPLEVSIKVEKETPSPSSLTEAKIDVKEEVNEDPPQDVSESQPKSSANFLESTRVTDPCRATEASESAAAVNSASSSLGSLKFFLGGRLVLRLNAQQDSGSGTKCQWVQSNDLPKYSNNIKHERHKKKFSFASAVEDAKLRKKAEDTLLASKSSGHDFTKKPKLKARSYEFSESEKQGQLLCSSSWTPPVADGHESIEVDDCSSKTSEGYVSPVLFNSRLSKIDVNNSNSVGELGDPKSSGDPCLKIKADFRGGSGSSAAESCSVSDSASKNICVLDGKNSPSRSSSISPYKQEVLNHKSALCYGKSGIKSLYYPTTTSHSTSNQLYKHWNKWPSLAYSSKSSPSSLSSVSAVDLKNSHKDNPLDLSSKMDCSDTGNHSLQSLQPSGVKCETIDKNYSLESDLRPIDSEYSSWSSNHESRNSESPCNSVNESCKCPDKRLQCQKCLRRENSDYSPNRDSENSSHLAYAFCNLPYHYALPKCTKEFPSEEMPLDLSSAHEISNKKTDEPEKLSEDKNLTNSENSETVERGMLYQLLKNKTGK